MSGAAAVPAPAASLRRVVGTALLAYLAFVIYGSLVPLRLQPLPLGEALARFANTPMLQLGLASRADLVANLLLFVPLAFLLRERLVGARGGAAALAASMALWLACAALAVAIEFTQVFFPARTVSLNDIAAEAAGAAGGLLLHALFGARVRAWALGWWQREGARPLAGRLLQAYLLLLLLFAVMPLDLTLSPVELYHKYQEGRVRLMPFADLPADPAQAAYDLVVDVLLWLPVGLLWRLSGRGIGQAAVRGLVAAAVLELLQLFVYSRVSSVTDVITAGIGCGVGAWFGARLGQGGGRPVRRPWLLWWALWALAVLAVFWFPFDFGLQGGSLAARLDDALRVPFATYYAGSEFQALNELLRKSLMFLPGGLLWAGLVAQHGRSRAGSTAAAGLARTGAVLALLLALVVEAGQLLLPGKVADLTDAFLEASGAWLGLFLGARLFAAAARGGSAADTRDAVSRTAPAAATVAPAPAGLWLDALLAVLLALLLWQGARLSGVPYNVVELLPGSLRGLFTALGVALVLALLVAGPLSLHARLLPMRRRSAWLLLAPAAGGLLAGLLLLAAAPQESLWDIVGAPVLDWPAGLEEAGRATALLAAMLLASIGAVWAVRGLATGHSHGMLTRWLLVTAAWALPLHAVVVSGAATDNLTELMRDGGGPLASALLFTGLVGLWAASSAVAAVLAGLPRRGRLMLLAAIAWPLATLALWQGSEPMLVKYDKAFSAAQFLLSSDREHYVGGPALLLRHAAACAVLCLLVAWLQWPGWRRVRAALAASPRLPAHAPVRRRAVPPPSSPAVPLPHPP